MAKLLIFRDLMMSSKLSPIFNLITPKFFIICQFFLYLHYIPNLRSPKSFNEYIQWLKLNYLSEKISNLADKFTVREYVTQKIGGQYLNELIGIYDGVEEINFESLPEKCVLKATHGSGWNYLIKDKSKVNIEFVKRECRRWLDSNYYYAAWEPVYKNLRPRIICERFIESENDEGLIDYKFFCFNGEVKFIQVDSNRFTNHKRNIYDTSWNLCPVEYVYPNNNEDISCPENLSDMVRISENLAATFPFLRVDLYSTFGRIIFGELTFFPEGGFGNFNPKKWDLILGQMINIKEDQVLDIRESLGKI